jgi:hypothetical protein
MFDEGVLVGYAGIRGTPSAGGTQSAGQRSFHLYEKSELQPLSSVMMLQHRLDIDLPMRQKTDILTFTVRETFVTDSSGHS